MTSISDLIVNQRPEATGAMAQFPYDEALAKRFRLMDRFDEPYLMYVSRNGKLFLPRNVCPVGEVDNRTLGREVNFEFHGAPRDEEQDRVICETYEFLQAGKDGLVVCPTGFGKTFCAFLVTALMRRPALVITTKEDIFDQWIEGAQKFLGLKPSEIGILRQDRCDVSNKPFSVGMVQSCSIEGKYPSWVRKAFGLIHFDECHRLGADEFSKVAGMFTARHRVGWSATPDRSDGREVVFHAHIGPVRVKTDAMPMIPGVFRYRSTWECPLVPRTDPETGMKQIVKLPHKPGRVAHVVKNMVDHAPRNKLICKLGKMAYNDKRRTVIFSDQRAHLETFHGYLVALGVPPNDIGYYVGGMKKAEKAESEKKPIMLATYSFMGEGSDVPALDCAILGTPRSDVRQIVGRVLRKIKGKRKPVVIDILDDDSYVFAAYAQRRLQFYHSVNAEVTDVS